MEMCKRIKARKMYREYIKMTEAEKNKGGKRSPKCSFNREMKDQKKKKKRKPTRLKTQKGSLGKS